MERGSEAQEFLVSWRRTFRTIAGAASAKPLYDSLRTGLVVLVQRS